MDTLWGLPNPAASVFAAPTQLQNDGFSTLGHGEEKGGQLQARGLHVWTAALPSPPSRLAGAQPLLWPRLGQVPSLNSQFCAALSPQPPWTPLCLGDNSPHYLIEPTHVTSGEAKACRLA